MKANPPQYLVIGESRAANAADAVAEAAAGMTDKGLCFVFAILPECLDVPETSALLSKAFRGVPVFGCSSAGQITTEGYDDQALLLMGFPKKHFRCASMLFRDLRPDRATSFAAEAQKQAERFRHTAGWNRFALIVADGLSKQEDLLVSTLDAVLGDVPIFGGSAADGLKFERTFVLHDGQAHSGAAVLLLIETDLQFQGLAFDHFQPDGAQIVITSADPEDRLVYEINGAPAADEYARLVGCPTEALSPEVFAENPMMLRHNLTHYARAISDTKPGGALSLLAAIDDGLILTLGKATGSLDALLNGLSTRDATGHPPDFILGFDCFLRRLEFEHKQLTQDVSNILRSHRVIGFNTYGEQKSGLHMNQTFVGVAFFRPEARVLT
ncbi:MAG: FIST N-terminal domain-containing protein [Roseovarius sp.]